MIEGGGMMRLLILAALAACACDRQPQQNVANPVAPSNDMLAPQGPTSKPPAVVPMPQDQAELDRLILAGYTPHGDHLHRPGVKECPLAQGSEAVM